MAVFMVLQVFLASSIIASVFSLEPIVSVDVIENGRTFTITCDASRVADLDPSIKDIKLLTLSRQTSRDTSFQMLAEYTTLSWWVNKRSFPSGRNWLADISGINGGANNRRTMKIFVQVLDAQCADDGVYMCQVTHNSTGVLQNVSTTQTVTSKLPVSDMTLEADTGPVVAGQPYNYNKEYKEGDNVTLTCKLDGEEAFEIHWKQGKVVGSKVLNITDYPYPNDITDSGPTFVTSTGPCDQYEHRSVLKLPSLSEDYGQVMYMCVVMENGLSNATEVGRANLTIGITSNVDGNKGDGDTGAVISGSIVGCILIIIAVVVVI